MDYHESIAPLPFYGDLAEKSDGCDSTLEQALCRAPFFQEKGLRLYRRPPLGNARLVPGSGPDHRLDPRQGRRPPYLLCQGSRPLLFFRVLQQYRLPPPPRPGSPGILDLGVWESDPPETSLNLIREAIELILQGNAPQWEYAVEPVPQPLWPRLVREGMAVRTWQTGQLRWDVSQEARAQGLCWGWYSDAGKIREGLFWNEAARRRLEPEWTAGQDDSRSLKRRLQDLDNGRSAVKTVERLANTDLGTYLRRSPEDLDELREVLHLGPGDTCSQAAALILKLLRNRDKRLREEGVSLMRLLAGPLTE